MLSRLFKRKERSGRTAVPAKPSADSGRRSAAATPVGRGTRQQRRRVLALLVLHAASLAAGALMLAAGMVGRQQLGVDEARRLLTGSAEHVPPAGAGHAAQHPSGASFSAQRCADGLPGLPQVALLFLVTGPMPHEQLWRLWFRSAAAVLPADALSHALGCGSASLPINGSSAASSSEPSGGSTDPAESSQLRHVLQACAGGADSGSALNEQLLFNVYVHPHPDFPGYPPGSLFAGRELPQKDRVATAWGEHSLVDAARALLRAARRERRNREFVLLSESDLPLYPPHLLYLQLLGEPRSRLNACNTTRGWSLFPDRWVPRMETARVKRHHWRKSWQWFALSRRHVDLVLADTEVDAVFRAHCRTTFEADRGEERECYSDEHYFATLLAVHGLDRETDCQGWLTDTDWRRVARGTAHPWHYEPGELDAGLVRRLRHPELPGCSAASAAAATARGGFLSAAQLADTAAGAARHARAPSAGGPAANLGTAQAALGPLCERVERQRSAHAAAHVPLGPQCRLLARKFLPHTAEAALAALAPCTSTALVLNDGVCPGETAQQAAWRRRRQRAAPLALLATGAALVAVSTAAALGALACPRAAHGSGGGSGGSNRQRGRR